MARRDAFSGDDIPRIDRPADWAPDWSAEAVAGQRRALAAFEARWKGLDASPCDQVDALGSVR